MDRKRRSKEMFQIKTIPSMILLMVLFIGISSCKKDIAEEHDSGCQHNLKETAVGIMMYKEKKGEYPNTLTEMVDEFKMNYAFIRCPLKDKEKEFIYHKPQNYASSDFIVLECPFHPKEFKYRLENLGVEKEHKSTKKQ